MAGLGRKDFQAGAVLSAADVDGYLMDQTVMVFATSAAAGSAIGTAVSEGMVRYLKATDSGDTANQMDFYNGSAWESVRQPDVAGKNKIINGGFDVFQRSTFASQTASNYSLDRWYASVGGTVTITQQTTGVPVGAQYCMRVAYNASSSFANTRHALSSDLVAPLRGQTVTLSAKVRRNASFAANLSMNLYKNATADTQSGGSWTSISSTSIANASMPTGTTSADWYTVTATVAIPNDGTANGLRVEFGESAAGSSGQYYEVANVQLEVGSVATPFSRAGGTLQGELAACQRYFVRLGSAGNYSGISNEGGALSLTIAQATIRLPVTMRTAPTSVVATNVAWWSYGNTNYYAGGTFALNKATLDYAQIRYTHGSSVLLAGQSGVFVDNNSSTGSLDLTAEL